MKGRIIRSNAQNALELPEIGRLHVGMKAKNQYGKEYPTSVDYFIPSGKYADAFRGALGDKPQTIQIIFPSDDSEIVCNECYEYRDNSGALVAQGDGVYFLVWNGGSYVVCRTNEYPDIMAQIAAKYPKKARNANDNGWDISLTLKFIIPAVRGIVGVWKFTTKGAASSINNIRNSFDGVLAMRGTVTQTVFDLSVKFAKSNKPGQNSRYPVVSLVANDNRIAEIKDALNPTQNLSLLLPKAK